jgi:hypothetical protein
MLMVTSTVRMLHGILGYTTNLGPVITLDGILVVGTSGLEQGLVGTTSTGNNTNLGTHGRRNRFLSTRRKTQTGCSLFFIVSDNNSKGARASSKGTTVATLGFNVADNGTFGDSVQGQDVTDGQGSLLSAVNKLSRVHAFGTQEVFGVSLIPVSVQKLNPGDGSTTTRVVQDFLDNTANVTFLFGIIQRTELDGTLARTHMGLEDGGFTLTLCLLVVVGEENGQ